MGRAYPSAVVASLCDIEDVVASRVTARLEEEIAV